MHKLHDFVRPTHEPEDTVWRVIEVKDDRVTAELRPKELTRIIRRVQATADQFISLEETEGNDQ